MKRLPAIALCLMACTPPDTGLSGTYAGTLSKSKECSQTPMERGSVDVSWGVVEHNTDIAVTFSPLCETATAALETESRASIGPLKCATFSDAAGDTESSQALLLNLFFNQGYMSATLLEASSLSIDGGTSTDCRTSWKGDLAKQ